MSVPKLILNLDGSLKKRSSMQDRDDGQPGLYSPRPSSASQGSPPPSSSAASTTASSTTSPTEPPPPLSPPVAGGRGGPPTVRKPHVDPTPAVVASVVTEEAAIGITDPVVGVILSGKSRHSGGSPGERDTTPAERTSQPSASGAANGGERSGASAAASPSSSSSASPALAAGRRAAAALATLVDHQKARQQSPGAAAGDARARAGTAVGAGGVKASPATGSASITTATTSPSYVAARRASAISSGTAAAGTRGSSPATATAAEPRDIDTVRLEEAYVLGRTFRQFVASTSRLSVSSITGLKGSGTFRQNPSQYISAIASSGDFVAMGDRTGHVAVMKRKPLSAEQHTALLAEAAYEDAEWAGDDSGSMSSRAASCTHPRTRDPYEFHVGQQAYTSVIDPLNSVEVTPNVSALAFLPHVSPAAYLLTSNEKVPKLYKVMTVRESAAPFRAVDKIDAKTIGPLTAASRGSTVAMKPIARYALSHEYDIHSICPLADAEQFVTADDLTMQLWCTEYPDTSIETLDLRPPYDEVPREAIRCVRTFPHEPFLLFAATSAGTVRVIDVRQTLRWSGQTPQLFVNPPREGDGSFSNVTNSLSDCALSPCGRYIAGRDFMAVSLWDVRVAAASSCSASVRSAIPGSPTRRAGAASAECSIVQSWELHPNLRGDLENLYQSDLLFERFDVQFMNHREVCTGGFGNSLYTIDVTRPDGGGSSAAATATNGSPPTISSAGVKVFKLPTNEGVTDITRTWFHAKAASSLQPGGGAGAEEMAKAGRNSLGLGSRITLISRPTMALGGTCGMMLCCGQVMMQLSYKA